MGLAVGIVAILFISMFALDAVQPGVPTSEILTGLGIHLLPSLVLVLIVILAWRRPLWGGIALLGVAMLPFVLLGNAFWVNALISAPFAVAGVLFIAAWRVKQR